MAARGDCLQAAILLALGGWLTIVNGWANPQEIFLAVPNVTVEMEKTFLAEYKSAVAKQDPSAWLALNVDAPGMDAKTRQDFTSFVQLGLAMENANPIQSYAFEAIHPGQQDDPTQLDGKTYVDNLPAVIAFKVSFAPSPQGAGGGPDMTSVVHLLGLQDHELKLVGVKEDSQVSIPQPAPLPTKENYGFTANVRPAPPPDQIEFASLDNFISALKQPGLDLLASGQTEFEYYGIYRLKPNLLVYAGGSIRKDEDFTWMLQVQDTQGETIPGQPRWIALLDNNLGGGVPHHEVTGTVFEIPAGDRGPLTLHGDYQRDDGTKASSFSRVIDWK